MEGHSSSTDTNALQFNSPQLSLVKGPADPPLSNSSVGQLLEEQARKFPNREAIVVPWTGERLTYYQLNERSKVIGRGLLALGIGQEDRVAISSGNCARYVELFFAVCRIGATILVLNPAYTVHECEYALRNGGCKVLFTLTQIGRQDMRPLLRHLKGALDSGQPALPEFKQVIIIRGDNPAPDLFLDYDTMCEKGRDIPMAQIDRLTETVECDRVCNLQFTSGTTGFPKATMLTHRGLVNNGRVIADRMQINERDIFCSPPPLFHGFGIFLCLMTSINCGSSLVFPNDVFDAKATLKALVDEHCTGFHGVPTMYVAVLQEARHRKDLGQVKVRTGITSGAPVPAHLMQDFKRIFGMPDLTIIYGLTETTGAVFMTAASDKSPDKLWTVGTICPNTLGKVISPEGKILPRGARGELCVAGYSIMKGYFRNLEQTNKTLYTDTHGITWLHTGDEATIDGEGYCRITGRLKDIIIRGGENIYPVEIENRLAAHPAIAQSSVVGLKDEKYQEIVAAFVEQQPSTQRPTDEDIREWVKQTLGRHKVPARIFWIGKSRSSSAAGVGTDSGLEAFPTTASGKLKKVELRDFGNAWLTREKGYAKL